MKKLFLFGGILFCLGLAGCGASKPTSSTQRESIENTKETKQQLDSVNETSDLDTKIESKITNVTNNIPLKEKEVFKFNKIEVTPNFIQIGFDDTNKKIIQLKTQVKNTSSNPVSVTNENIGFYFTQSLNDATANLPIAYSEDEKDNLKKDIPSGSSMDINIYRFLENDSPVSIDIAQYDGATYQLDVPVD